MGCSEFAVHGPQRERSSWGAHCWHGYCRECHGKRCRVVYSFCWRDNGNPYCLASRVNSLDIYDMQYHEVHRRGKSKDIGSWSCMVAWTSFGQSRQYILSRRCVGLQHKSGYELGDPMWPKYWDCRCGKHNCQWRRNWNCSGWRKRKWSTNHQRSMG
jgi:hypothetical protein